MTSSAIFTLWLFSLHATKLSRCAQALILSEAIWYTNPVFLPSKQFSCKSVRRNYFFALWGSVTATQIDDVRSTKSSQSANSFLGNYLPLNEHTCQLARKSGNWKYTMATSVTLIASEMENSK